MDVPLFYWSVWQRRLGALFSHGCSVFWAPLLSTLGPPAAPCLPTYFPSLEVPVFHLSMLVEEQAVAKTFQFTGLHLAF